MMGRFIREQECHPVRFMELFGANKIPVEENKLYQMVTQN